MKWVISGGNNGQDSIRNGVDEASNRYKETDLLLIHDAIRPLVTEEIISDCIVQCENYGSAIVTIPCTTAVLRINADEDNKSNEVVPRNELAMTQTPQAFPIGRLKWAHEEALRRGITNSVASCTMMIELGEEVHFSQGSETNIKLTTQGDLEIFKSILKSRKLL